MKTIILLSAIALTMVSCNQPNDFDWASEKARLEFHGFSVSENQDGTADVKRYANDGSLEIASTVDTESGHSNTYFVNIHK